MTKRRNFLNAISATVAGTSPALAQRPKPLPMIGRLTPFSETVGGGVSFVDSLGELGWYEGRNCTIVTLNAQGDFTKMEALAAQLVALSPDVIFTPNSSDALLLRKLTSSIPIVVGNATDPIGAGLIASYRRPGGNVTGFSWDQTPGVTAKYVEFLKEMVPNLSIVGCLIDPSQNGIALYRGYFENACAALKVKAHHKEVRVAADIASAIQDLVAKGAQALFCYGSSFVFRQLGHINELAVKHRLPDIYVFKEAVALGGLMSFAPNPGELGRQAARYVDKILKGANPAELPMELPSKYELLLNRRAATRLGLKIPQILLARADEVID